MAGKYWWEEYEQQKSNAKNDEQEATQESKSNGYWWDSSNMATTATNNITSRVNTWLKNHNNYITNYQTRNSGRKYNYEDSYMSDSASWLDTVSKQKSNFDAEADAIISYMDQYKDYLDNDWMKSVRDTLNKARTTQGQVLENYTKDNEYWSMFTPNEEQTAAGYTPDKVYKEWQEGQKQYAEDMAYDVEAGTLELEELKKERDAYRAGLKEQNKKAERDESFWESLGRWMGTTPDTTLPLAGVGEVISSEGYVSPYDKQIDELEEKINRAKYVQGYEGFMDNMDAEDYAANSRYVSTRTDVALDDARWGLSNEYFDTGKLFGDHRYDYINRNPDALSVGMTNDTSTGSYFAGVDEGFLKTMSDEEIGVYNYLYKTQSPEAAEEFLSYIASDLKGRKRMQEQAFWAGYAKEDPVGSSVFSVMMSPLKGMSYLGQAADMLDDGKMEENAGYNRFSYIPSTIRSTVSTTIENSGKWGEVGSFAYNTGMSMADFLFTTGVSGGNQALSLAIMGTGAAADATLAAKDRGLDDGEAFALGTIAGVAEVAMEKISLGAWLEGDMTEGALRYLLKNALSEGGEEAGTSVINLLADVIISGDKSEWNTAMQAYIDQGKTPGEAFGLVAAEQAAQIGLDALGGMLSGAAIGGGTYAGVSVGAGFEYGSTGKNKESAQKLVTESLELIPDSQYAQKMQSKLDNGKALTGMQVRNLLAANQEQITTNDIKKIQNAAQDRLTSLGQTENVEKIAELATKWATGQELTRAEKKTLANSTYGSRVANELLPSNIMSGDYSTEWAEGIGTKQVNATAYNKKQIQSILEQMANLDDPATYKSLEERVNAENKLNVSENGKATIRATGEAIDLGKVEVTNFVTDKKTGKITDMTLNVDGKEVKASEIDYADDSQSYLYSAISKIENITPGDATTILRDYDPASGQTVGEYLNGIDEAYTYGYHGYSEADMGAGQFTTKLTKEQAKGAYLLGQAAKKFSDDSKTAEIKRMRTAVEAQTEKAKAEGKEAPKAKKMTITYNAGSGNVVDFDNAGVKLTNKQKAAPVFAQVMHEMGLGTNFELFSSYVNKNGVRVFIDDNGVEQKAYSGMYRKSDGTIRIDLNAYNGRELTLDAMAHELTHFIQQWSDTKYNALAEFLVQTYEKTDMTMHERVLREQTRLEGIRGEEVSYNEAYDEVVANAMSKMLADGNVMEKLAELKAKDAGLAQKLWEGLKKLLNKFFRIYEKESAVFFDAADLMELKAEFEQLQQMWAEAFAEASENFQASLIAKEAGIEIMRVEDGVQYSYSSLAEAAGFEAVQNEDGTRSFVREGKKVSKVTVEDIENSPIGAFINFSLEMKDISKDDADRQKKMFADICTMACKTNDFAMTMQFVGSAVFTGMKANADKQYGTTYDFPSICTKTQAVIDAMSAKMVKLGRGLNTNEIVQLYEEVFASGNPVPCPECYVFSRWIGIGGLLDNIKKYQDYYGDMDIKDVAAAYLKMKAEVTKFADEQGISFGKAKGALTTKLTKEYNKLTEKIEKAQNQGEKVKPADKQRLAELEPMMNTVKSMTWLENVYFADSSLKKVNPNFRVPDSVLFDLNNGEAFATKYNEAWAFRTTQGAGYGKAITPYAEARLGEGVLVTNNTTNAIKGRAQGSLDNYFLQQMGKLDKKSRDALKRARLKQKIQAFIGGQRFQSTSDARYENASDYLLAALEMQAMGGMVQVYTKVDGAVPAFSAWGFSINQSLMPLNGGLDADGNVKDTAVGGMKPEVAFENRKKHESAGTITIGVNDNHIRAMFKQWVRDFIIPYHASGGKADTIAEFRRIQEGKEAKGKAVRSTDYSRTQSDKVLSDEVLRWQGKTDAQIQRIHEIRNARIAILTGGKPNMTVVRSNRFLSALYDKLNGGEWDGVKLAKSKVESQIYPNEFWDQTVTYDESVKITKDYLEYCEDLGFLHRFSGMIPSNGKLVPANGYNENGERVQLTDLAYKYDENGNKTTEVEEFFWKVLTDRRMYDNNGNYLAQKIVTLNDTTTDTVTGFAKNNQGREYDKAKAEALAKKIVGEQYSSQETDLDSDGNQLSAEQMEFFKDSVVRDSDGKLMVMYHGTANGGAFTVFDGDQLDNSSRKSQIGQGFYFTNMKNEAESYTKNVDIYGRVSKGKNPNLHQVYLNITNPFDVNADSLDIDKVKSVYMDGTSDHFFDSYISHYLNNKTVNGRVFAKAEVQGMSKADRVSLYVDYLAQIGTKELLSNMVQAFKFNAQSQLLASMQNRLGYDGIVEEYAPGKYQYVAFSSEQIKNVDNQNPTTNPDIRYSSQETDRDTKLHPYSYDALIGKPNMVVTTVDINVPKNRADVVYQAKQNAAKVGKFDPKTGSVSVYVDDVGENVVLGTPGLKHGLEARREENSIVTLKAGEILKHSIRINELTPKKDTVDGSYVLVGSAKSDDGSFYIVRSVVNKVSHNLISMDVLYAINAKKGNRPSSMLPGFQGPVTDSTITIAELLDLVNQYFPDILPEDVLKHYGYDARPEGDLGKDALYSSQETDLDSNGKKLGEDQLEYFEKSKVRDRNGRLQVVYHGGTVEYEFDTTRGGKGATQYGPGAYFTDSEYYAKEYTWYRGGDVKDYYLNIEKMFDDTNMGATVQMPQWKKLEQILRKNGIEEKFIKRFADAGFAYMSRYLALKSEGGAKTSDSWEGSERLNAMLREAGFDGIKGYLNDAYQYAIFTPNQAKLTTNEVPSTFYDTRYSTQETDNVSNRDLLANAFEGITNGSEEYKLIQKYKGYIAELNSLENKLSEFNRQIREIRFTEGKYDAEKLRKLESEAKKIADAINKYDQYLLALEASGPLRKVIERERKKEAQKTREHVKEIQQNKKARAEQTELRHKIRKAIRDLDKILNKGNKKLNVKEDMQNVVSTALKAADILFTDNYGTYDMLRNGIGADLSDAEEALVKTCTQMLKDLDKMPTDGYDNWQARQAAENKLRTKMSKLNEVFARERKRLNNTTVSSILGELADAYAKLEESEQSYVQGAYSEPVHTFLKSLQSEIGGTIVQDMTKDQLESVYAAYKMVLTTVRTANKMFNEELKLSREQLGNAVIEEVLKAGGVHLLGTKMGDTISQFDWNNMKPVWVGNRIGSETFGKLMNGLFKGQYNFAVDIAEAKQFKQEMDDKYHPRNWDAEKQYDFVSSTGKKFSLNLQQIMSLYAFSKREQAYSHLLNGGFVFEDNSTVIVEENGKKKTYIHKGATSYKVNEATLNGIINSLTKEQKAYVDEMQKYLSEVMGEKGNEVSMALYGIKMFNEQFYFPLRSSGAYMEKAKEAELKKQQGQINLVNSGFTHAVKPNAKNPIVLSGFMDVWAEHCNEMSMYHSMVLPMEDFRKVYNYTTIHDEKMDSASVYQTIQDAYGKAATNYIDQLYKELNAGATVDPRETPWKKLISNFKKSAVMLSGSVVVQQFSSIGRAYAVIDPRYFIGSKVNSNTNLSATEEMKKYAPVAIIKEMGGFDTGTKGSAKSYIMAEQYGKGERVKGFFTDEQYRGDIMGYMPAKADELTWCAIWEAAKREIKAKNPKMDVKSDEFLKLAGERFSEVIEKTQVYDSVLARSANMRSKGNFMAMATAFMAEPTTTVNLIEDAIRSGKAKNIARAFGSVAVSIVLNNALASIVYAMRDDDEDETLLEKYFQSFTSGMIDDINPMSYYPFLKDVYSLFQGYDVERADMSVIADVRDALKKTISLLGKDTSSMDDDELAAHNKQVNEVLMGLLDAGCSMFGVPVKNVRRDAMGIINAWKTVSMDLSDERDNSWLSFWDKVGSAAKDTVPILAWTKDKSKQDKLYNAIISGDEAYLGRMKSTYKTDSAYQSAVRKALRENDPRIKEAAQARYDGNTDEYKRIFREIQNEGNFSFDDIMSAINTELAKLTPDKETSKYTASDFVESIILGDAKSAEVMKEDIIATKVANGKTQEEAEKEFTSNVETGIKNAYTSGLLDDAGAEKMLMEYADMEEEDAVSKVSYWSFVEEHQEYKDVFTENRVAKYLEFAEPAGIPVDVYVQFINGTKDLGNKYDEWGDVEVTKREQVLEVIDSLDLTWEQKDALYLAAELAESKIWDVPW